MTDDKTTPPKPPERRPAEASGVGAKRPYATLDLKATEVPAPGAKTEKEPARPTAEPRGTAASATALPGQPDKSDTAQAAARIAAAASAMRQDAARPAAAGGTGSRERTGAEEPDPAPRAGSMRGYASHLGAGLLGGLVVLGASQIFLSSSVPTTPGGATEAAVRDLQQKLAALQQAAGERPAQRLEAVEGKLAQIDTISGNIASLREGQAALAEHANAGRDAPARLGKLEEQIGALAAVASADPQAAQRIGQMAQVTAKLGELGTRAAEAAETARSETQRLDREVASARSDAIRIGQRVDVLRAGSDRLEQSLRALQADAGAAGVAMEKLKADVAAQLSGTAKSTDISAAMAPVSSKISALDSGLQGVMRAESERKANAERIVLSLELGNLKRALDRGGGYAAELAAVRKVAGDRIDLAALERYQQEGLATAPDLARQFRGVANAVLDADAEQPDASLVDRLLSGARTVVRVRKVTHSADDTSTEAIVGRIETAVQENRLADALAEGRRLPAKAAVPAHDWLKKVEARHSVDAALAGADAALKAALGANPGTQKGSGQ